MAESILRAIIEGNALGAVKAFRETGAASEAAAATAVRSGKEAAAGAEASAGASVGGFGRIAAALGPVGMAVGIAGVATAALGGVALEMASKYDDATAKMSASAGITKKQAEEIGAAFLSTSGQTVFSAQKMMEAYSAVAGQLGTAAGHALDNAEALKVMNAASALAAATGGELGETTKSVAQTMFAFKMQAGDASQASDILFNVSTKTGLGVGELGDQLAKAHAKTGDAYDGLTDLSAVLLDLKTHGLTDAKGAISTLTTATQALQQPSANAKAALQGMGLSGQMAALANGNLGQAIAILGPKLAGMSEDQRRAAENAIFGAGGYDKLNQTLLAGVGGYNAAAAAANKQGTAQEGANKATDNIGGSMSKAGAAFSNMGVTIGQKLTPFVDNLARGFAVVAQWAAENLPGALDFLGKAFNVVAGIIGPIIDGLIAVFKFAFPIAKTEIEAVVNIFKVLATVVGAVIGTVVGIIRNAVSFIVAAFKLYFEAIGTVVNWFRELPGRIWDALKGIGETLIEAGKKLIQGLWAGILKMWDSLNGWLGGVPGKILGVFAAAAVWLIDSGKHVLQGLWDGIKAVWSSVAGWFGGIGGRIIGFYVDAWKWLINAGISVIKGLSQGIGQMWLSVAKWFGGIGGNIIGFFGAAWSWLVGAGDAIVRGLGDGIRNGAHWIWDAIKSLPVVGTEIAAGQAIGDILGAGATQVVHPHAAGGFFDSPHMGLVGDVPEFVMNVPQVAGLIRGVQAGGGGGGGNSGPVTNNFYISNPDPATVVSLLKRYMQMNGSIPIRVNEARVQAG